VKKVPFAHPDQHISLIALCLATTLLIKMPKTSRALADPHKAA
jgi:hypothetical protein